MVADFVDQPTFLSIMGSLASGVTIVATLTDESQPIGLTCSAACSVSREPPLLLVCIHRRSHVLKSILSKRIFTVNVLCAGRQRLSGVFASPGLPNRFASVDWRPGPRTGLPCLPGDCVALAECFVCSTVDAGDHTIVIGGVLAGQVTEEPREPLMYWRREYGSWRATRPQPAGPPAAGQAGRPARGPSAVLAARRARPPSP